MAVPESYFQRGWDRRLSFAGKTFYLLNLHYSAASPIAPRWSFGEKTLSRRHGLSLDFLRRGVRELRRANLVEVEYDDIPLSPGDVRHANTYFPNPLYDPASLEARLRTLETEKGAAAVARARRIAALVYEDSDGGAIEALIDLEERFGRPAVEEAVGIIKRMRPDNPKRSIAYLIGIIKRADGK